MNTEYNYTVILTSREFDLLNLALNYLIYKSTLNDKIEEFRELRAKFAVIENLEVDEELEEDESDYVYEAD